MTQPTTPQHRWSFFRAGGFDQVKIETGADIANVDQLDQKLWVALACPTRGLEFDSKTLEIIDLDKDGRIRPPELITACKWATAMLKNPDDLVKSAPSLPLTSINDAAPEGAALAASAKRILVSLGKAAATVITLDDVMDTARIFAQTKFNGDGIVPPDAADDPKLQAILNDIISCLGAENDRSGKPGINQARLDQFFADAQSFISWSDKSVADAALAPLGPNTPAGAQTLKNVAEKIDDYFARCRLAAFDPRATAAVNLAEAEYAAVASKKLTLAGVEMTVFPLARIEPNRPLPLVEGLNPGWRASMAAFNAQVVIPLLGEKQNLTESEWAMLIAKFAPFDTWLAAKSGASVEKLGLTRVKEIMAFTTAGGSGAKTAIGDLLAKDKAVEPEFNAISSVERLVRYHRDLYKLLNNFISFRDFYARRDKATFQAGVLYLDQRACELCIRVEDAARHAAMAHLAYSYLAYCDLTRKASGEKMSVACAFTAGDSDNLMVGRNGIFYDRQNRDWDATITKIVDHPISIRQAFWLPYKRLIRWIEEQVAKRAAAADSASTSRLQAAATTVETSVTSPPTQPPPPPPPEKKMDVGAIAVISLVLTTIAAAFGALFAWLAGVPPIYIPFYALGVILLISTPSMLLAALKLRQRNLGPILDANGWAVNAKAKINIPFGGALTKLPKLPPGSTRDTIDPFAESHRTRNRIIALAILIVILTGLWYFGVAERVLPGYLPPSSFMIRREEAAKKQADKKAAEEAAKKAAEALTTSPATSPR